MIALARRKWPNFFEELPYDEFIVVHPETNELVPDGEVNISI